MRIKTEKFAFCKELIKFFYKDVYVIENQIWCGDLDAKKERE